MEGISGRGEDLPVRRLQIEIGEEGLDYSGRELEVASFLGTTPRLPVG